MGADVAQHVELGVLIDAAGVAGIGGLGAGQTLGLGQGELALVVEVDQRIEAVLIPEILGHPVIPHLTHHVEGQVIELLGRVGGLPLLKRRRARLFELCPHLGLQMFDGIGPKTVDAKAAYPVGVPGDEIVAHGGVGQRLGFGIFFRRQQRRQLHRLGGFGQKVRQPRHRAGDVVGAGLRVAGQPGAHPVTAPPLVPLRRLVVDELVVAMPVEAAARAPLVPDGRQLVCVPGQLGEPQILQVGEGGVTCVVHHHVEDDAHAALVRFVHQGLEALFVAVVGVNFGEVERPVAVVGVEGEVALLAAANETVHLLHHGGDPDGVDAKLLDVIELGGQPLEVTAVPGGHFILTILLAPEAVVIGGIAVVEAVGQQEIDTRLIPAERCWLGRLDRLE